MFFTTAIVFVVSVTVYALALVVFPRINLLDFPGRYGLKRTQRLPYPTGSIAVMLFVITAIILFPHTAKENGMIVSILLLAAVSFIDDRTPLPSSLRLGVQVLAGITVFITGSQIFSITNPLGGIIKLDTWVINAGPLGPLPVLSGMFTLGWLLLTINALNWFDGITGQVSVLSAVGFWLLGCLALFRNGEPDIALMAFTLGAIASAGALFDFPPAKMLMGDTGSMFFGLMLGLIGIYHGGKVATAFLALGIPLLDALFVAGKRLWQGHSPFRGGQDHLHHRLLKKGWSERQIVLGTAVTGMIFGITALFLDTAGKGVAVAVLVLLMLSLERYAGVAPPNAQISSEHSER